MYIENKKSFDNPHFHDFFLLFFSKNYWIETIIHKKPSNSFKKRKLLQGYQGYQLYMAVSFRYLVTWLFTLAALLKRYQEQHCYVHLVGLFVKRFYGQKLLATFLIISNHFRNWSRCWMVLVLCINWSPKCT